MQWLKIRAETGELSSKNFGKVAYLVFASVSQARADGVSVEAGQQKNQLKTAPNGAR